MTNCTEPWGSCVGHIEDHVELNNVTHRHMSGTCACLFDLWYNREKTKASEVEQSDQGHKASKEQDAKQTTDPDIQDPSVSCYSQQML